MTIMTNTLLHLVLPNNVAISFAYDEMK